MVLSTTAALALTPSPTVTISSTVYDLASTTTLPATSSILGQSVTFLVTAAGAPVPTGAVNLYDGASATPLAIVQLNGAGSATYSTSILAVAAHSITAVYQGDTNYSTGTSAPYAFTVNPRPVNMGVTPVSGTAAVGVAATITGFVFDAATVGPGGANGGPTGEFRPNSTDAGANLQSLRTTGHAASLLSDGTVLISGGTVGGSASSTFEIYTPGTILAPIETFTSVTGNMLNPRSGHTATLLSDGVTTLITGGDGGTDAELFSYNPVTVAGSSLVTGALGAPRSNHTATLLPNGQVLIIGGTVSGSPDSTLEVYDSAGSVSSAAVGTLAFARSGHTTTLVGYSGGVATLLVAGGDATGTAELITFNTAGNIVTQVGSAPWATARTGHTATLLADGDTILFAGGTTIAAAPAVTATAELYQISSISNFTAVPPAFTTVASLTGPATVNASYSLTTARTGHTATLLPNDFVVFIGGETGTTTTAEDYTPAYDPQGTLTISDLYSEIAATSCTLVITDTGSSSCSTTLTPSGPGPRPFHFTYATSNNGDQVTGGYDSDSLTVTAAQTITFNALPNVAYGVAPITLTATASSSLAVSYAVTGPASISGSTLTITGAGSVTVTASQPGDGVSYAAATPVSVAFTVTKALLTVTANNASIVHGQTLPSFSATITGFVNTDTSAVVSGAATETTTATITSPAGTYPIAVAQGTLAAANYTFTFVPGTLTVTGGAAQTITFPNPGTQINGVAPITLTASSTSGLAITYAVTSGPATVSGSTLTITGTGSVTVQATQAGNGAYAAAPPVSVTFAVNSADFTFNASGGTAAVTSQTVQPGSPATYTVQVSPASGSTFNAKVVFTLTGLPAGATFTITPSTIAAGSSGPVTVTVTVNTVSTSASLSSPKSGMEFPKPLMLAIFLPLLGTRKLRRALQLQMKTSTLMVAMLAVLMGAGMTACGGGTGSSKTSTPAPSAQTYNLSLSATSGTSTHVVPLTLTVQ
jgi:hypothetical protein